jgi:pimeloyl-ACP methyl ester carboxylesterase
MADGQTLPPEIAAPLARFNGEVPPAPAWFEWAVAQEPERSFIDVDGAEIELLTWGEVGKPGLLFLHGNGAHADWWSFIAPFFAKDWRCAAISWSGMGGSGWREAYSGETFAREAFAAVDAAQLEAGGVKPIFIAHSFGGFPTMFMASRYPERLRGAVLVDSSVQPPEKRWTGPPSRTTPNKVYGTLEEALGRFRLAPPQGCENLYIADFIARRSLRTAPMTDGTGEGWTWKFDPFMWPKFTRLDFADLLPALKAPVAMIWGERSALMNPETVDYMLGLMPPDMPKVVIPDADHHVMIDQPLAFVTAVRGLLAAWKV